MKVEPQRWYYWADRIGLMVWQDMPSTRSGTTPDDAGRRQFETELRDIIDQLRSSPSIVTWVPFNEGWGEYDPARIADDVKRYDPSRLVSNHWKRFQTGNKILDYVIGNWQLNTITSFHSGLPFTLGVSGDIANTGNSNSGGFYERLNLVGDPHVSDSTPALWFNTKAFAVPAAFTFGNLGRNTQRSDWSKNVDLSLFRSFPIHEKTRLEFRAEAFNATNTPVWGTPVANYSNTNFGQVISTANTARQLQLAMKLYF